MRNPMRHSYLVVSIFSCIIACGSSDEPPAGGGSDADAAAIGTGGGSGAGGGAGTDGAVGVGAGLGAGGTDAAAGGGGKDGASLDSSGADGGVAPLDVGLDALVRFARLPFLRDGARTYQFGSTDPAGQNNDQGNYLGVAGGEATMFDAQGPGVIYRFWHTGDVGAGEYRFYFDGATTPSWTVSRKDFWSTTQSPFGAPLTMGPSTSSGGYVTYFPIAFEKSLRVTTSGQTNPDYYNFTYTLYGNGPKVTTYTGKEDATAAVTMWNEAGKNPIPADPADQTVTGTVNLTPGVTTPLAQLTGPHEIVELRLSVANVGTGGSVDDDGRAHKGTSSFQMAIDPANQGVRLVRRMDHGIGNQKANVAVDGAVVGVWFDSGSDTTNHWRDSSFDIPVSFTQGKSTILIKVTFVSSDNDWNEFTYWTYSKDAGGEVLSDTLDVGKAASETAHQYAIVGATWAGAGSFQYPASGGTPLGVLAQARLQIAWDGEATPSVDAPVLDFFGTGAGRAANVKSLPVGNTNGAFYCFFPMPFAGSATVSLANPAGSGALSGVTYTVIHRPFGESFAKVGNFHALYTAPGATVAGTDYTMLRYSGSGHFVGVNLQVPGIGGALEGNERLYVDGVRSPGIQGTGTEDYFNGGWYFDHGAFSTQTHGALVGGGSFTAYRFHLSDVVPFSSGIVAKIQHGSNDGGSDAPYGSVAYFYATARQLAQKTDDLDVGDAASETAHGYAAQGGVTSPAVTGTFFSDDPTALTETGKAFTQSSTFTVKIGADNDGVVLRRLFDQASAQAATVSVDGAAVGLWSSPGSNSHFRWREEDFWIPRAVTTGKTSLAIEISPVSGSWNEFHYQVMTELLP